MTTPPKKSFLNRLGYVIGITIAILLCAIIVLGLVATLAVIWRLAFA